MVTNWMKAITTAERMAATIRNRVCSRQSANVDATVLVATMFRQMGLVSAITATRVVYLDAILYLGAGIIGTGHHWYFTGQGTLNMCLASAFSAMEVVPLTLLTLDAWDFVKIKDRPCAWPRLESATHIMTAGSARPLEDAFRIAQLDLVQWLGSDYGLDPLDAYQLVTQAVESPLANVCDPNYTSVAKIEKRYLPRAPAMDGAHTRLTDIAASYRGA